MDNIEPALNLDGSGQFLPEHRRYVELLRVLSDCSLQSFTLITSRERLNEGLDTTLYSLPSLTVSAWDEFWQYQGLNADLKLLIEIHRVYGGNALAMKVLCNPIINDYQRETFAYWQDNQTEDNLIVDTALANLIQEQFERLKNINIDAYNLLCRLGCYRYQDVPTVSESGLNCLLWDVTKNQHKRIIRVLKERALIEFYNSEYWLHPVIREVAIDKLRNSEDWKKVNAQAADFWTESVKEINTINDALKAFEAYHHYLNNNQYQLAGKIIIKRRYNQLTLQLSERLARAFYRFGLLQFMQSAIMKIIDNLCGGYILAATTNILGDICWSIGDIHQAIKIYERAKKIAIDFNFKNLEIAYYLSMGLCYIDIWEIEKALSCFLDYVFLVEKSVHLKHKILSYCCLAFLNSCLKFNQQSLSFIHEALMLEKTNIIQWSPWSMNYKYLFLGKTYGILMNLDQSTKMYKEAVNFSEKSNYPQVKGKALTGLAELYRIQNDTETALNHHQKSIVILDEIGARCDLAEAYFQLALTYQKIEDQVNAQEYFNKALYLWSPEQIDAPKQIERVNKAMNQ